MYHTLLHTSIDKVLDGWGQINTLNKQSGITESKIPVEERHITMIKSPPKMRTPTSSDVELKYETKPKQRKQPNPIRKNRNKETIKK